ncbi:ABC transporter permease subunit [Treponema pedis]|uniref:ABC transporter permease subunit n=1 Tax=Treponema pedis TaxID=409322 RepID=UPI003D1F7DAC
MDKKESNFISQVKAAWGRFRERTAFSPLTEMRLYRFKQIKRARISYIVIVTLFGLSLFAELLMNNRPLIMKVDGKLYFPTYSEVLYAKDFKFQHSDELELNYRKFKEHLKETGRGWLIMPLIPYNPYETDSAEAPLSLTNKSAPVLGVAINKNELMPTDNRADYKWIDISATDGILMSEENAEKRYVWIKFSSGPSADRLSDFPSKSRNYIGFAYNKKSKIESETASDYIWLKIGQKEGIKQADGSYTWVRWANGSKGEMYHPLPPSFTTKHFFGTDRIGRDVLARLFYAYRIAMSFSLLYVFITYTIGITIGILMGYIGGFFDTIFQRFIEILERIPFIYIVMILSSIFKPNFGWFLLIYIIFGWSARTWSARAMTYRERERDYILAARSMGASTMRIVLLHILPNIIVIIVTALPFAISGGIASLTSLDYLGYGLRPPTPSWGELLSVGTQVYKSAPWILTATLVALVSVLILITFIGEGLREAFDPKRYTVYK